MKKREPKGNGSVRLLPSGKWLVKVPLGRKPNGATRYRTKTCANKTDARHWQTSLVVQRESQMLVAGPRQTFRQFAEEILMNSNDRVSDRTRDGYFRNLRKHVFPVLGARVLTDLRAQDVERLLIQLRRDYSASTVNNVRIAIARMLERARESSDDERFAPVVIPGRFARDPGEFSAKRAHS